MSLLRRLLPRRRPAGHRLYWLTSDIAVSREPGPQHWADIRAAGIRAVVDVRAETEGSADLAHANGLQYLRAPIDEGLAPTTQELSLVTDWILARIGNDGPVLVHCREGRGRSPLVACAALVKLGIPPFEAYQALRRARPEVALSPEQEETLRHFAQGLSQPR
jgi:protein-tyrosine phosphatase